MQHTGGGTCTTLAEVTRRAHMDWSSTPQHSVLSNSELFLGPHISSIVPAFFIDSSVGACVIRGLLSCLDCRVRVGIKFSYWKLLLLLLAWSPFVERSVVQNLPCPAACTMNTLLCALISGLRRIVLPAAAQELTFMSCKTGLPSTLAST